MMNPLRLWVLLLLVVWGNALTAQRNSSDWLVRFNNGVTVSQEEFEYVYQKNNGGWQAARQSTEQARRDYLKLYIQFKRKVMAAQAAGLDTTPSFRSELATYLRQLAQPYMVERNVLDQLVREAHERSRAAVKVSHILVRCAENASPADTLAAYNKALALRDSVLNHNRPFEQIAALHSDDPSARQFNGYLSWFTAFDFIYPFETAAYTTQPGSLTQPIRTQYGYHIIKVMEKKQITGIPRMAHILIRFGENYAATDSAAAVARAQEVYNKLRNGADWNELVAEYSDDPNSKARGGDLGSRYIGVPQLQDRHFSMAVGEISQPFASPYGIHIVKITEMEPLRNFEDVQQQLKTRVSRDPRAQVAEAQFIASLKREYNYLENPAHLQKLLDAAGPAYTQAGFTGENEVNAALRPLILFSFAGKNYTIADFLAYVATQRRVAVQLAPAVAARNELDAFVKAKLFEHEETQLARKYPEYRYLSQEYRDGILLFTLTEQKVWRRAVDDTTGLRQYWESNRNSFQAPERVAVLEYRGTDSAQVAAVAELLAQHPGDYVTVDSLIRERRLSSVRTNRIVVNKNANEVATQLYALQVNQRTPVLKESNRYVVYCVLEFRTAGPKTFDEAKAEAITQFQDYLEKTWLQELERAYTFRLNEKVFKKLFRTAR